MTPRRVDVGALVDLLAEDLLGRHVFWRADHVAGLRELRVALLLRRGDAEVHDLDQALLVDQHVGGLQVAVDDAGLVRDRHARRDVDRRSRTAFLSGSGLSLTSWPSVCDGKYSIEIA